MARFHSKWIKFPYLGLMCLMSQYAYSNNTYPNMNNPQSMPMQQVNLQGQGLEQNIQILLNEHGLLLNEAILAALNNAPANVIESGKANLFKNSKSLANVIASINGPQAGQTFEKLFNEHISGGAKYINAIKANNSSLANQIAQQATANGRSLAKFFSNLNPSVPYETWQKLFDHHVTIEAEQTKAYFKGDINQANQLRDESLVQLKEVASFIASALSQNSSSQMRSQAASY